jgi:pyruvate/2-oxoglutarate dehydrogenase complex dihydrolipoamide dehydrogenase (E3) component
MKSEAVELKFNAKEINVSQDGNGISIKINGVDKEIKGSHLLLRRADPNTDMLQLENTSINFDEKGYIAVDDYCKTNVDGVFAIGDCNGKGGLLLTMIQIVEDYMGNKKRKISDRITTYGLFIDPPLGRVGMTKSSCEEV